MHSTDCLFLFLFLSLFPFRKIPHVNVNFINWWMDYNNMTDFFLIFSSILFKISSLRFPSFLSVCNVILNNYEGGKKDEEAHKKIELKLSTHIGFFSLFNSETILLTYLLLPAKQLHSHERKVSFKIFFFCVYLFFSP